MHASHGRMVFFNLVTCTIVRKLRIKSQFLIVCGFAFCLKSYSNFDLIIETESVLKKAVKKLPPGSPLGFQNDSEFTSESPKIPRISEKHVFLANPVSQYLLAPK